ncbi:CheY-like superfamily protein [Tribonema minus]|uniref:CheY-like superfamily protein n=1 Tax=Tribonema minus TaxID=303371 RepID=A0A835YLM9_9STRA|nr:CheY-like superfamily protein [Tribonema minus]
MPIADEQVTTPRPAVIPPIQADLQHFISSPQAVPHTAAAESSPPPVTVAVVLDANEQARTTLPGVMSALADMRSSASTLSSTSRKPLVLVVDDEGSIRKFLERMLAQRGYRVVLACDGMEALGAMKTCSFHAVRTTFKQVLLDLNMPRMGGLEALVELRRWEREQPKSRPLQYVCVISANCSEDVQAQAYSAGTDLFLPKPIDLPMLVRSEYDRQQHVVC